MFLRFGCLMLLADLAVPAHAALITVAPSGGTTTVFGSGNVSNCTTGGSGTVAGLAATSTGNVCLNYSGSFGLSSNGNWNNFNLIGDNSGTSTITINLGGGFATVGGLMNYSPITGTPTITALAANGTTVLESYDLSTFAAISTPNALNASAFRGISRGSSDIFFFRIGGSYIVEHDITLVSGSQLAVPEPSSFALTGGVLGLACLFLRRLRS